jgi:CheY-like chemotaxis protein
VEFDMEGPDVGASLLSYELTESRRSNLADTAISGIGSIAAGDDAVQRYLNSVKRALLGINRNVADDQPDMQFVGSASTGKEGIRKHRETQPDITLLDLRLPDISGIDVMLAIRGESAAARIILLTMFAGDIDVKRALEAGAQGYC